MIAHFAAFFSRSRIVTCETPSCRASSRTVRPVARIRATSAAVGPRCVLRAARSRTPAARRRTRTVAGEIPNRAAMRYDPTPERYAATRSASRTGAFAAGPRRRAPSARARSAPPTPLGRRLDRALVEALVVARDEQDVRERREAARGGLIEEPALRREEHDVTSGPLQLPDRGHQRLRLEDHARAAAVRDVVHRAMAVRRPVAQVVGPKLELPSRAARADARRPP